MSWVDFEYEELSLGGGAALASGKAEIKFLGSSYQIVNILYPVFYRSKDATYGFCPYDIPKEGEEMKCRLLTFGEKARYEYHDLLKSDLLFTMIVDALRDQYDDHIWDLYSEGKSDYSQHSTLNHAQQGIDR